MTVSGLRRIVLIGFMGSGKTSVGRMLASELGWRFADFDQVVEEEAGMTVAEIFARHGEPHFRSIEERVARRLLQEVDVVLGSGGGWAAQPGRLRELPEGTATVWLKVSPGEALLRASKEPGSRPLLAGADAGDAATRLLAERTAAYAEARWAVDTEGSSVEDVSARIVDMLATTYPELRAE